jgi:myo-inositol-1(or 4)-monophosphatase
LPMEDLNKIKETAVKAAVEAGKHALKRIGDLGKVDHKESLNNLVTDVDRKCEGIIIDSITREFPSHSILAEESGEHNPGGFFKWIVDPLDGTTNYTHGFPVFCVSIGVMSGDSVRVGVVYDPMRDELFTAEEGKGAFLNNSRIRVSRSEEVQDSLIATGFAYNIEGKIANVDHFKIMLKKAQAVRRAGSAVIDLCYVACGRFDGFWELGLAPWDTAAGQLIVKEAGGTVTTLRGGQFDIFKKEILATNGRIHEEMLGLLT